MKNSDGQAYEAFSRAVEKPLLVLALLFIPILVAPLLVELTDSAKSGLEAAAWLIWGAFAAEYAVKLYLAPDRRQMIRTHIPDLIIVVVPFLRPLRALRLLRLLQIASALGRAGVAVRRVLGRRGFSTFLVVVLSVIVASGALAWAFERGHPEAQITSPVDGVWWAVVTSTTVGYGDLVPVTPEGRGVAVLLMLVGIALLSVVTANIAAFFVEQNDGQLAEIAAGIYALQTRLDRIEESLVDGRSDRSGVTSSP